LALNRQEQKAKEDYEVAIAAHKESWKNAKLSTRRPASQWNQAMYTTG